MLKKSIQEQAIKNGLKPSCVESRLKRGWTLEDALSKPSENKRLKKPRDKPVTVRFEGKTVRLARLVELTKMPYRLLYDRIITRKWSVRTAITTPIPINEKD